MTSSITSSEQVSNKALAEVLEVFKVVFTKLLRTSSVTMRRVIFSKNNEEFNEIILGCLIKGLQGDKFNQFLNKFKSSEQKLKDSSGMENVLEKIFKILFSMKEEKLKMILEIIRIISGLNSNKSDLTSLMSSDASAILTTSEKISSLYEENSLNKDIMSLYSLGDGNGGKNNKESFLSKIRKCQMGKKGRTGKYKSPTKKRGEHNLKNVFSKTYEMSDKTSLFSNEEIKDGNISLFGEDSCRSNNIHDTSNLNNVKNVKTKTTKINTQIQNKFNINVISPSLRLNTPTSGYMTNTNNSSNIYTNNNYTVYTGCPKVIIDYEQSSSDLDSLLVISGMEKKKMIKKQRMGYSNYENSFANYNSTAEMQNNIIKIPNNLNTSNSSKMQSAHKTQNLQYFNTNNTNNINNSKDNLQNFTKANKVNYSPQASSGQLTISPGKNKTKQIFFPCEINQTHEYEKEGMISSQQSLDPYTSKYNKMVNSQSQNYFLPTPNSHSTNIFNNNFMAYNTNLNNPYPFFSVHNTPNSSASNNAYLSDLILHNGNNNSNNNNNNSNFKQPTSGQSKEYSLMNTKSIPGPIPINFGLYKQNKK